MWLIPGRAQPLHIAVKNDRIAAVRLLLQNKAPVFLLRDCNGSTPLHLAVARRLPETARLIGEAGPKEALVVEDGVGNAPLEIAVTNWLKNATGDGWTAYLPSMDCISNNLSHLQADRRHTSLKEVALFQDTLQRLTAQGRLRSGTKLATELAAFAQRLEGEVKKRTEAEAAEAEQKAKEGGEEKLQLTEGGDATKTLDYIAEAVAKNNGVRRRLVHLIDVHVSVKGSLDRTTQKPQIEETISGRKKDDEGGLDPEEAEDKEKESKSHSAVSQWHRCLDFDIFGDDPY